MSLVQLCLTEMQTTAPLLKFYFFPNSRSLSCTVEGRLKNNAELIVKTCASEISTITVGENGVVPVKQLRENTITSLDLSNKGLGVDGGLILAALIKNNTSVQHLDVSANELGPDGGFALAGALSGKDFKSCCSGECSAKVFSGAHYKDNDSYVWCRQCFEDLDEDSKEEYGPFSEELQCLPDVAVVSAITSVSQRLLSTPTFSPCVFSPSFSFLAVLI